MHRRRSIDRRVEIVAQGCAERLLEALVDRDMVDHRRPQVARLQRQHLAERLGLGFQPLHALFGFAQSGTRGFHIGARIVVRGFGGDRRGFRLGEGGLRAFDRGSERRMVRAQRRQFALDLGDFGGDARDPLAVLVRGVLVSVALGGEVGERGGEIGEDFLGGVEFAVGRRHFGVDAAATAGAFGRFLAQHVFFGGQPRERGFRVGGELLLALAVGGKLHQPQIELGKAVLGARFLAVEVLQCDVEAVQRGAGARLGLAQFGQRGGSERLPLGGLGFRAHTGRDFADTDVFGVFGFRDLGGRGGPAQMVEHRLRLAHLRRHGAIADRLARLLLQPIDLGGELADHVLDAQQVGFRRFQPQFGFVPARMQSGDAGGFLQHAAALLGLGLDDLADAALMHQRRRARAGGGVGEQDLHVARAHLAAVDAIGGAGFALDATCDVDFVVIVERGRRRALGIVDRDRHFGIVARRAVVGAGENDLVHGGGAHGLVGGFAHHPAQRFHQIGFAAAVRPDDAGQARLDEKIGRLDERLEPEQAQPRKFHNWGLDFFCLRMRGAGSKPMVPHRLAFGRIIILSGG